MSTEETTFNQGSTLDWTLPLKNNNGSAIDLSTLLGYAVFLYNDKGKIVKKYSNNELDGFEDTLTPVGAAVDGNIRMINEASHTASMEGEIFYIIKVQANNDDYENDKWSASTPKAYLMTILKDESAQYESLEPES